MGKIRTYISTKQFGADEDGKGITLLPKTDTEAVLSTKLKNADGTAKTLQKMIDDGDIGGGGTTVQSDWAETDDTQMDYIKNKPDTDKMQSDIDEIKEIIGTKTSVRVELISQKTMVIGKNDTSCVLKFIPRIYNGTDMETGTLPMDVTIKVINPDDQASGGSGVSATISTYSNIQQSIDILSSNYSTLKNHLMSGDNTIIVTAEYEDYSGSAAYVATYTLLTFACNHDWSKAWIEGETYGIGNITFNGNIVKVLHCSIDDSEVPSKTFKASENYKDVAYTFDLTTYFTTFAKTTGVHTISVWITTNDTELYRVTYNIMCVLSSARSTAKLVCINNVNTEAVNGKSYTDDDPLFQYAVYGTTSCAFHVVAEDNVNVYSVDEQTRTVVAETQYNYTPSLNIGSTVDAGLTMTAVLTAGGSFNQSVYWDDVDNSNTYAATAGAVFYMNPQNRDNAESAANRKTVKNEADQKDKDVYASTWQNFSFGEKDGWTTDDENNRCLAVPAGSLFSIDDWTPLNRVATASMSLEMKIKVQNVADYDTPLMSIMSTDSYVAGTTYGVIVFPTKILVLSSGSNNENQQMVPLHEDERTDIFVVFQRGVVVGSTSLAYNLCRIFVNGVQNAIFEYPGTVNFGTGSFKAGQANADLYIYKLRQYNSALEYPAIKNNFLSSFIDSATEEQYTKEYIRNRNDLIPGSGIDYATAKSKGFNCMVVEMLNGADLPDFFHQTGGKCNVTFEWGDDHTKDVTISNSPIEGQGSTSSKYYRWNLRWKCKDDTIWTYADGSTSTKKGKLYGSDYAQCNKVTAKKNIASSQQGHKMGATSLYNDLYKLCVANSSARLAVWQKPVLGFLKLSDNEYSFIGHYTVGPDKGDKKTFGYSESTPYCLSLEGPNHTPRGTRFLAPWKDNTTYISADEDLNFDGQQGWDVDYGGSHYDAESGEYIENETDGADDNAYIQALLDSEFKPAYKAVFNSSQYIAPLADTGYSTLDDLNAVEYQTFQSGTTDGVKNEYMTFYNSDYDLICFNYSTKRYEVVSGYNLLTVLGLSGTPTRAEILAARQTYFNTNVPKYWNKQSLLFVKAFHLLICASDNEAKNTYPFKIYSFDDGGLWEWREDDLDTILATDNNGNSTKSYSVETTDVNSEGSLVFQGSESVLWRMVEDVWADDLKAMMRTIVSAMQTLASNLGITGDSIPETMYNVMQYYFWSHSAQYFPMVTYNEDAAWSYITPWQLNKLYPTEYPAYYNSNVYPLTQALGDQLAAEKQFVMLRLAYVQSKFLAGGFHAGSNAYGYMAMTTAESFAFKMTPAIDVYPAYNVGGEQDNSLGLVKAGDTVTLNSPVSSNTTFYIEGTDWLSDLGDLSGLVITNRGGSTGSMGLDITGARLTRVKFGDEDEGVVKFNATTLTIAGACIKTIEGRNARSVTGTLNLSNCPRLQTAYFQGTSLQAVLPPISSRMSALGLPATANTIFLHTLPNLQTLQWESDDRSKIGYFYIQNTPGIDCLVLLRACYKSENSALHFVTMMWSDNKTGLESDLVMLYQMATHPYEVLTQSGYGYVEYDSISQTIEGKEGNANIQGELTVNTRLYADEYATLVGVFNALTLNVTANDLVDCVFTDEVVKDMFSGVGEYGLADDRYSTYEALQVNSLDFSGTAIKTIVDVTKYFTNVSSLSCSGCESLSGDVDVTALSDIAVLNLADTDTRNVLGLKDKASLYLVQMHAPTSISITNCSKLNI